MSIGIKIKSISVEDLGSIVKQIINKPIENTEEITKLHQVDDEEWYFKKIAKLKNLYSKKISKNLIEDAEKDILSSVIPSNKSNTKYTLNLQSSKNEINNYTENIEEIKNEPNAEEINISNINMDEQNSINKNYLYIEYFKNIRSKSDSMLTNIKSYITKDNIYLKTRSLTFNNINGFNKFNSRDSLKKEIKLENNCINEDKNIVLPNDTKINAEIVEVWNNNPQIANSDKKTKRDSIKTSHKTHDNKMKYEDENYLAFENWKKQKNIKYKQMIKQEQKERQQRLQAKLAEMESKRLAQTCARMSKQQTMQKRRKLSKELRIIEQKNLKSYKEQMEMKRIVNDKVFKEWKRRKDIKLREQKMLNRYANYYYYQQQQQQLQQEQEKQLRHTNFVQGINTNFDSWLNQLDWVLHEKYLRERRYLVRSFYCQPAYYGNAADIAYANYL